MDDINPDEVRALLEAATPEEWSVSKRIAAAYLAVREERDRLRAERDEARRVVERLKAEVDRLRPLLALCERIPAVGAPFELCYHPSDVGDPGWTSVVAGYADYGTLDAVITAACGRLGVFDG